MWHFEQAQFLKSAPNLFVAPHDIGQEVAFVGRSNSGKSSAINAITGRPKLARTSKTPGRTQLMNFFALDEDKRLVDLPGYGYAKVNDTIRKAIEDILSSYLYERRSLSGLILLMDIRHPLMATDQALIDLAISRLIPVHILLTKCDKLNRGPANQVALQVSRHFAGHSPSGVTVQTFSGLRDIGIDEARHKIASWLESDPHHPTGHY